MKNICLYQKNVTKQAITQTRILQVLNKIFVWIKEIFFSVYRLEYLLIFPNHFSWLCRSLEECITLCDNGTLLYIGLINQGFRINITSFKTRWNVQYILKTFFHRKFFQQIRMLNNLRALINWTTWLNYTCIRSCKITFLIYKVSFWEFEKRKRRE